MNKPTWGVWTVFENQGVFVVSCGGGWMVAEITNQAKAGEQLANAHLMSAAKTLLVVLQDAFTLAGVKTMDEVFGSAWCDKAAAAIAKALGEQP